MKKILIVDDSKAMRLIVRKTLRQAGYGHHTLDEAENGLDALQRMRGDWPDVVLCDFNMPEMSGLELLRAIKDEPRPIKFGFVTTESTPEMWQAAVEAGAAFIIAKPFTVEIFQRELDAHLG